MRDVGIYIHIPFCNQICPYCDFYSEIKGSEVRKDYVKALRNSIKTCPHDDLNVKTIYFGGGTPSVMEAEQLIEVLNEIKQKFHVDDSAEITTEANPESASFELLQKLYLAGFTRVSFGVQSSDAQELKALGRIHDVDDAKRAVLNAKKAGFENISADLMLGTPHQTQDSALQSVEFLSELPLNHISAYMLGIEEGTPFDKLNIEQYCMSEEDLADAYLQVVERLADKGFEQYEISNFAKQNGESLHNLKYWRTEEYLGFGPSAHSFFDQKRFAFGSSIDEFIKHQGSWQKVNLDSSGGDYAEYGMLRLRLTSGLDLGEYKAKYPEVNIDKIMNNAIILEKQNLAVVDGKRVYFTPEGFLASNYLIAQLLF